VDDIDKKVTQKLKDVKKYEVNLILSDINNYFRIIKSVMNYLVTERGMGGVYVSTTRPSKAMISRLGAEKINMDDVFFVDSVSYMAEGPPASVDNVIFIESPTMLEMMMIKTDTLLRKAKSPDKFVFFDSINSLAIYNSENILSEFIHVLVNSFAGKDIYSFILSVKGGTPKNIEPLLRMVCDNVVEIGGE